MSGLALSAAAAASLPLPLLCSALVSRRSSPLAFLSPPAPDPRLSPPMDNTIVLEGWLTKSPPEKRLWKSVSLVPWIHCDPIRSDEGSKQTSGWEIPADDLSPSTHESSSLSLSSSSLPVA